MKLRNGIQGLILLHFLGHIIHVTAHFYHGVPTVFITNILGQFLGYLFILLFFILLPVWGWWQMKNRQEPKCYYLLAIAMAPAWAYAFMYHFILNTSDYICLFGATIAGRWFTWSAVTISVVDAALFMLCIYAILRLRGLSNRAA